MDSPHVRLEVGQTDATVMLQSHGVARSRTQRFHAYFLGNLRKKIRHHSPHHQLPWFSLVTRERQCNRIDIGKAIALPWTHKTPRTGARHARQP